MGTTAAARGLLLPLLLLLAGSAAAQQALFLNTLNPEQYAAVLVSQNVVPFVYVNGGVGIVYFTVNTTGAMAQVYSTICHSLEDADTISLFRRPEGEGPADFVLSMVPMGGNPASAGCPTVRSFAISGTDLTALRAGRMYVQIEQAGNDALQIRGPLEPRDDTFIGFLSNRLGAMSATPGFEAINGMALLHVAETLSEQPAGDPNAFLILNFWIVLALDEDVYVVGLENATNSIVYNFGPFESHPPLLTSAAMIDQASIQEKYIVVSAPKFGPGSTPFMMGIQRSNGTVVRIGEFSRLPLGPGGSGAGQFGSGGGGGSGAAAPKMDSVALQLLPLCATLALAWATAGTRRPEN